MLDQKQGTGTKDDWVVPEALALVDNLTARENLTFIGAEYLTAARSLRKRIDELLSCSGFRTKRKSFTRE